jgi:uncharacterized protein YbjT (DUF2867 family)
MYVIAGATGHTGTVVANTLLAQHVPVRVIVRSAEKGEAWKKKGAEVAVADLTDTAAVKTALAGATGAFFLVPPNFAATDLAANARKHINALKGALEGSSVKHVVFLSSVGAQQPAGTGPVATLYIAERELGSLAVPFTFLRAGYFMENLLGNLHPMKEQGVLPALNSADLPMNMIATADIGAEAASLLRQGAFAPRIVELSGPKDRTLNEAAALFSTALGKPVKVAVIPPEARVGALTGAGLPPVWAQAYAEMGQALDSGHLSFTGPVRRGVITLEAFVRTALS